MKHPTARVPHPRWALVPALLLLFTACGEESRSFHIEVPASASGERSITLPAWDTVFVVGGATDDTLLLEPTHLAADAEGVAVADFAGGRVMRFGRGGEHLWSFGQRGPGPDEFRRPVMIAFGPEGRTWVLDVENERLTGLDGGGAPDVRIPLGELDARAESFAPLEGGGALVRVADPEGPLVRISDTGRVVSRAGFPWPEYSGLPPIVAQMESAAEAGTGRWAAAFIFGDGFFIFSGPEWTGVRGWYREAVAFAGTESRRRESGGREETETRLRPSGWGALSVALSPERLLVLFGGRTEHARRIVDTYSTEDGSYTGSFLLPGRSSQIAYADGILYVLRHDPYPTLLALRMEDALP